MVAIVDYGVGNLFSLRASLEYLGADVTVTGDAAVLRRAGHIILPGVGAFGDAAARLGEHRGLGLLRGDVTPIAPLLPAGYKVPQIGWNALHFPADRPRSPIFKYLQEGDFVYFVHSYHAGGSPDVTATCEYGAELTAAVGGGNVFGCQFHPEKSGPVGLEILRAFCQV